MRPGGPCTASLVPTSRRICFVTPLQRCRMPVLNVIAAIHIHRAATGSIRRNRRAAMSRCAIHSRIPTIPRLPPLEPVIPRASLHPKKSRKSSASTSAPPRSMAGITLFFNTLISNSASKTSAASSSGRFSTLIPSIIPNSKASATSGSIKRRRISHLKAPTSVPPNAPSTNPPSHAPGITIAG